MSHGGAKEMFVGGLHFLAIIFVAFSIVGAICIAYENDYEKKHSEKYKHIERKHK